MWALYPAVIGSSNLYIFNSGTHEAVMQVNLDEKYKDKSGGTERTMLRKNIKEVFPELHISFEPIELTEKIMAQGASTPIEVRVAGKNFEGHKNLCGQISLNSLKKISYLRDVQIAQPCIFQPLK